MTAAMTFWRRSMMATAASLNVLLIAGSAQAQSNATTDTARRIDRLERELRAVQRKVFPGAESSGVFAPEVGPAQSGDGDPAPAGNASLVGDLSARLDSMEAQLARITGEVETQGHRQRELDTALTTLRTELTGRLDRLDGSNAAGSTDGATALTGPATATPAPTPAPRPTPAPTSTPPANTATAERRAKVAAIEVPATGNAAEDAYLYGYRLWEANLYPEAQAQLQRVVTQFPSHRRASYAGNLLGRAYLDNNQPALAIRSFYSNYSERPRGERAADSVYYMGMALIRMNRREDACRTFEEFTNVYGATASQSLKNQVAAGRSQARC